MASDVAVHVRAHLSSIATPDDDPDLLAEDVNIVVVADQGGVKITGTLDAEPVAEYLRDDFDPEHDVAANPLSVPSIEDQS